MSAMTKPARRRFWIDIVGDARDPMPCDAYDSAKFENLISVSELLPSDVILTREEAEKIHAALCKNLRDYSVAAEKILEAAMKEQT